MFQIRKNANILFFCCCLLLATNLFAAGLNLERLPKSDIQLVKNCIIKLRPIIQDKTIKLKLPTLTFDELYQPLNETEKRFLKSFQFLDSSELNIKIPYHGIAINDVNFIVIKGQKINAKGKPYTLPPQFLPENVYQSYQAMMEAMQSEIGNRLYVESAYRSPAYQLYLFVFYLPSHNYSIRETAKFIALPGYSEHGCTEHQALDFVSENGVGNNTPAAEFEKLPQYGWLLKNSQKFNFVLSYPKDSNDGITFEPWHWRYQPQDSNEGKTGLCQKRNHTS